MPISRDLCSTPIRKSIPTNRATAIMIKPLILANSIPKSVDPVEDWSASVRREINWKPICSGFIFLRNSVSKSDFVAPISRPGAFRIRIEVRSPNRFCQSCLPISKAINAFGVARYSSQYASSFSRTRL